MGLTRETLLNIFKHPFIFIFTAIFGIVLIVNLATYLTKSRDTIEFPVYKPQVELSDSFTYAESNPVSQEFLELYIQELLEENSRLLTELDDMGETVRLANTTVASASGTRVVRETIFVTDDTSEADDCNIHAFVDPIDLSFGGGDSDILVPIGQVSIAPDGYYDLHVYDLTVTTDTLVTEHTSGTLNLVTRLTLSNQEGSYFLPITSRTFYDITPQQEQANSGSSVSLPRRFRAWDPRLGLGLSLGYDRQAFPGLLLDVSAMTLRTKDRENILLRFASFGVNYEPTRSSVSFVLQPVLFNIGEPLPLFSDLYLGIGAAVNFTGTVYPLLTLGSTL